MNHDISLNLPDVSELKEMICFTPFDLANELYDVLRRFTRIPNYEKILPFVVAYELLPLWNGEGKPFIKSIPFIFCCGPSGSGKSTLGYILQRLNPSREFKDGDGIGISAGSNYKGWEQSLENYRYHGYLESKKLRPFPLLTLDDLTPESFSGQVGDLRLNFLKQVVTSNGNFIKGSAEGTPIITGAFCKIVCSSIHDLATFDGLSELERRLLRVQTRNIADWTEEDHTEYTFENELEDHEDYIFHDNYDQCRYIFLNNHINKYVSNYKKLKLMLKGEFKKELPQNRHSIMTPLIAMTSTLFDWDLPTALAIFKEMFMSENSVKAETPLVKLLRGWIESDSNPFKARMTMARAGILDCTIKYQEVSTFLKVKMAECELTRSQCSRESIIQGMSLFGFEPLVEGMETIFLMRKVENE